MASPERILCAAIHIDDDVSRVHQPVEIGYVVAGHRHHVCISTLAATGVPRSVRYTQGFITDRHRYVPRVEARAIAMAAGQVTDTDHPTELFSEDLY